MPVSPAWGFLAVLLLADLVANGARSLASRLAGSLAFAAAAGVHRLLQGKLVNRDDVLCHQFIPPCEIIFSLDIL